MTLFGDYWLAPGAIAPSGALVDLLGHFSIPVPTARSMLARLSRDGRLEVERQGRRTAYRLAPGFRRRVLTVTDRVANFGAPERVFDGTWTAVVYSVPEELRSVRHKLRTGLAWLGFGPLYDGLWVAPWAVGHRAKRLVASLEVPAASVIEGTMTSIGLEERQPTDAWDLKEIQQIYRDFLSEADPWLRAHRAGALRGADALVVRTELMNLWRVMPRVDPDLPREVLPKGWLRQEARAVFHELYEGLAGESLSVVRGVVSLHDPTLVPVAATHSASPRRRGWVTWEN